MEKIPLIQPLNIGNKLVTKARLFNEFFAYFIAKFVESQFYI